MAKKKKKAAEKKPEAKGLAAFREHNQKLLKKDVESTLDLITPERVYSSGSIMIDRIIGNGGFVAGSIAEVSGEAHSGKSTLCLMTARNIQRAGGSVAYLNTEQSMDENYARALGVDIDDKSKWFYSNENTYDDLKTTINNLIEVGSVNAIIMDSATAIMTKAELDASEGTTKMIGEAARFWSDYGKKLVTLAHKNNTLILLTNQIRVTNITQRGAVQDTTGGNALKFYKTLSVHLRGRKPETGEMEDDFGNKVYAPKEQHTIVNAYVEKNKWGAPMKAATGRIVPYKGYDNIYSLFQLAVKEKLITAAGAWLSYGSESDPLYFKVQGRENAVKHISDHPELLAALTQQLGLSNAENYFPL